MAAGIKKIHGFKRDEQDIKPYWNRTEIKEVLLVETIAPINGYQDDGIDLIYFLPSYTSGPGSTDVNPKQLTFTLYWSTHPVATNLILLECLSIKKVPDSGTFWEIELLYGNFIPNELTSKDRNTGQPITNPLLQPVIWSSSSNIVQKQTMTKPNGNFILHEHGKPITEPITVEEVHTTHSWSFNRNYNSLNYFNQIASYAGLVGTKASTIFGVSGQCWKFTSCSATEAYETYGTGNTKITFHYAKINITFEYNPSGWIDDAKLISRSTQQKVSGQFFPIDINGNGDRAQEPWPLLVAENANNCYGAPYDQPFDPNTWAVLDTGYPKVGNIADILNSFGLNIP